VKRSDGKLAASPTGLPDFFALIRVIRGLEIVSARAPKVRSRTGITREACALRRASCPLDKHLQPTSLRQGYDLASTAAAT